MRDLENTEVGAAKIQCQKASGLAPSRRSGEVRRDHQETRSTGRCETGVHFRKHVISYKLQLWSVDFEIFAQLERTLGLSGEYESPCVSTAHLGQLGEFLRGSTKAIRKLTHERIQRIGSCAADSDEENKGSQKPPAVHFCKVAVADSGRAASCPGPADTGSARHGTIMATWPKLASFAGEHDRAGLSGRDSVTPGPAPH